MLYLILHEGKVHTFPTKKGARTNLHRFPGGEVRKIPLVEFRNLAFTGGEIDKIRAASVATEV